MTRFSDDWDEPFPNAGALWWANARRALDGRKGRAILEELRTVLHELPQRRLIRGRLADESGDVCAVGAIVAARRQAEGEIRETVLAELARKIDEEDEMGADVTASTGVGVGISYVLAYTLAERNDEVFYNATPEERWERFVAWIDERLGKAVTA